MSRALAADERQARSIRITVVDAQVVDGTGIAAVRSTQWPNYTCGTGPPLSNGHLTHRGGDRHVPAINIKAAEDWSKEDAAKLKDSGDYTLSQNFQSRVETSAGTILSTASPEQVMERRSRALGQGTTSSPTAETAAATSAKPTRGGKGPKSALA